MDEKGFIMGKGERCKVICRSGGKDLRPMHDGSPEWVTVIEAVSAAGIVLLVMLLNKGEAYYMGWYAALKKGDRATFSYSKKGWTNLEHWVEWLERSLNQRP